MIMLPMEKERQVKKSVCQMVCLIVAQFIYLMLGSGMFMFLERESTQKGYRIALGKTTFHPHSYMNYGQCLIDVAFLQFHPFLSLFLRV